jgi:hypothetical protein
VPREAAGQGFSLIAVDEAVVRVAFRLIRDNHGRPCHSGQDERASAEAGRPLARRIAATRTAVIE